MGEEDTLSVGEEGGVLKTTKELCEMVCQWECNVGCDKRKSEIE
jgi:hypothetical protein